MSLEQLSKGSFAIPDAGGMSLFQEELEEQEAIISAEVKKTAQSKGRSSVEQEIIIPEKIAIVMENLSEVPTAILYDALDKINVRNLADVPTLEMEGEKGKILEELRERGEITDREALTRIKKQSDQCESVARSVIDIWGTKAPHLETLSSMLEDSPPVASRIVSLIENRDNVSRTGVANIRAEEEILRLVKTLKVAKKKVAQIADVEKVRDYLVAKGYTTEQLLEECLRKGYKEVAKAVADYLGVSGEAIDEQATLILAIKEIVKGEYGDGEETPSPYDFDEREEMEEEEADEEEIDEEEEASEGLLGWNRVAAGHLKMAPKEDADLAPLHRFYQERQAPVDPARAIVESAALGVRKAVLKLGNLVRLEEIQFQRVSNLRHASDSSVIDSGKVVFKVRFIIGSIPYRQATMFVATNVKKGKLSTPFVFYDATGRERLLTEEVVKDYYNIKTVGQTRRGRTPRVERALIDRTMLPETPAKSMFSNEQLNHM